METLIKNTLCFTTAVLLAGGLAIYFVGYIVINIFRDRINRRHRVYRQHNLLNPKQ